MHILFLSDNFPPEVNAPASRTYEHCRQWVKSGAEVTVMTCAPNFPQGKVYPGYKNKLFQTEIIDGIRVIRVGTYITANEGFLKRILDYASFMMSAVLYAPFAGKPDVVIGTSPQFFTVCAAYIISRFKQVPFVFELRDFWPESIKAVGAMKDSAVIRFFEKVEMFLYRRAHRIITVTTAFKRRLIARGIDKNKIHVVTNGVDASQFHPLEKDHELVEKYGLSGKFVIGYLGTHGMAHHLETILEAADQIRGKPDGNDYRFIMLGNGARKRALMEKARAIGLDNVFFIDTVPKAEVVKYWSLLDISVVHLRKTSLFTTVIPSKIFESMGMGVPLLHGVAGESADIVEREGAGLVFEPQNPVDLCSKLEQLKNDKKLYAKYQENGLNAAKKYDRSLLAGQMLELVKTLATEGK